MVFEERGKVSFNPLATQLYDVLIDKKDGTFDRPQTENNLLSDGKKVPSKTSIHDLLKNVLDPNNNLYFPQSHRGYIDLPRMAGDRQPARIVLSKDKDRSTVMHEMAHFYLWNLRQFRRYVAANNENLMPYTDEAGNLQRPSERVARAFDDLEKLRSC